MVCANCGQWSYRYSWISDRLADQDPRRRHSYVDPEDPRWILPARYWFMVCRPNSQLNAVRHASYQLEQEAADYIGCPRIMNTVEELRRAWIEYYAYGPDEHEARFESNARAKLLADLELSLIHI